MRAAGRLRGVVLAALAVLVSTRARATGRDFVDETLVAAALGGREFGVELGADSRIDRDFRLQGWFTAELEAGITRAWLVEGVAAFVNRGRGLEFGAWRAETRYVLVEEPRFPLSIAASAEYQVETRAAKHFAYERIVGARVLFTRTFSGSVLATFNWGLERRVSPVPPRSPRVRRQAMMWAIGARYPEGGSITGGFELRRVAAGGTSTVISGVTSDADGVVWACGRVADFESEPSRLTPVVYRYQGGAWAEVSIGGLDHRNGIQLLAIAAIGSGPALELRAVGTAEWGLAGFAIRYGRGQWSVDSLPPPAGVRGLWSLNAVGRAPDGKWYAAGGRNGAGGGAVYVDGGTSGWKSVAGPASYTALQFSAVAFDADGVAWFAANYPVGDSLQGVLFRYRSGGFTPVGIRRRSRGGYRINAVGFDLDGHGWAAGGRTGNEPFLAGTAGAEWTESVAETERDEAAVASAAIARGRPRAAAAESGGELFAVSVTGAEAAIATGYRTEIDAEGLTESVASVYELVARPLGEIDLRLPSEPRSSPSRPVP